MSTLPSKSIFFPLISARSSTQSRFHEIVEAMEAEFEAAWPSLSTVERQHALTALAQAKQFAVCSPLM